MTGALRNGSPLGIPNTLNANPDTAVVVVRFLAAWSRLDALRTHMITGMMGADAAAVGSVLEAIHSSARRAAILAAGKSVLKEDSDRDLFEKAMKRLEPIYELRNRLAHYVWGSSPQAPQGSIVLVDPRKLTRAVTEGSRLQAALAEVITTDELDRVISKIDVAVQIVRLVAELVRPDPARARAKLPALLKSAAI